MARNFPEITGHWACTVWVEEGDRRASETSARLPPLPHLMGNRHGGNVSQGHSRRNILWLIRTSFLPETLHLISSVTALAGAHSLKLFCPCAPHSLLRISCAHLRTDVSTLCHQIESPWNLSLGGCNLFCVYLWKVFIWGLKSSYFETFPSTMRKFSWTWQTWLCPRTHAIGFQPEQGLDPSGLCSGGTVSHCSVEILLDLNRTKGQLYPDMNRKHSWHSVTEQHVPHKYQTALKKFWIVSIRKCCMSPAFPVKFICLVGFKLQLGIPTCFSSKASQFCPCCHYCNEAQKGNIRVTLCPATYVTLGIDSILHC